MKPRRERDTEQSFGLVFVLFCLENHLWWIDEDGEQDKGDPVEQSGALVWFGLVFVLFGKSFVVDC